MNIRKLMVITVTVIILLSILISIGPSITGFSVKDLAITDIAVAADKQTDTEFVFEQSKENTIKLDKPVYYYLKIKDADFTDMNYFLIKFRVEKEWLRSNGLAKDNILLYYLKANWNKAETKFLEEDKVYYYYEARTEVSDLFAIAVERAKPVIIEEKKELNEKEIVYFAVIPLIFIGLIGLLGILFLVKLYKKIKYYRIVKVVKNISYFVILFLISNLAILIFFNKLNVENATISNNELLLFGLIPILVLSVILVLILHGIIKLYKKISLVRNISWFIFDYSFIFVILAAIFYTLPIKDLVVSNLELILYGILPLIILSLVVLEVFKFVERLVYKTW